MQLGIARAVNGADEDLVERGGDDADGEGAEACFEDGEPVAQGVGERGRDAGRDSRDGCPTSAVRKGAFKIFEPRVHLAQDGGVQGRGEIWGVGLAGEGVVPSGEAGLDVEGFPEGAQGGGELGAGAG